MIKSLSKRTIVFLLFISLPWAVATSKSQNNSQRSSSHKNEAIKSHAKSQVSERDIEELSPKTRTSQMGSHSKSPSQKITKSQATHSQSNSSSNSSSQKSGGSVHHELDKTPLKSRNSSSQSSSRKTGKSQEQSIKSPEQVSRHSQSTLSPQQKLEERISNVTSQETSHNVQVETRSPKKSHLSKDVESHSVRSHQTQSALKSQQTRSPKSSNNSSESNSSMASGRVEHQLLLKAQGSNKVEFNSHQEVFEVQKSVKSSTDDRSPVDRSHASRSHKSMDYGRDSINKSRSHYEKLGDNTDEQVCKKNLMTIFSVEGNHLDQAVKATPREKSYCRRNGYTCCSSFNIESISQYYGLGKRKLRLKFEILEELFALFRGPKFVDYVMERKDLAKCSPIVEDMSVKIKGHDFNFFTLGYLRYQLEMAENLLMDTEIYVKKILWFYGDSICAICSPKVQDYFDFSDGNPKVHMHINTCSERIEEREYERNLVLLYEHFISKTIEWIQCTEGVAEAEENGEDPDGKSEKPDEDDENEEALLPIDEDEKENFLQTFDECWNDQNVSHPSCQKFCMKNMRKYEFPVKNLFHNFKVSLKVMFGAMTGGNDIGEYYENIKEVDWKIDDENDPIDFFPESEDWIKYKMDDLEWEYHTSTGHNVFKEIMSKKFTEFEMSVSKLALVFFASFLALLI